MMPRQKELPQKKVDSKSTALQCLASSDQNVNKRFLPKNILMLRLQLGRITSFLREDSRQQRPSDNHSLTAPRQHRINTSTKILVQGNTDAKITILQTIYERERQISCEDSRQKKFQFISHSLPASCSIT